MKFVLVVALIILVALQVHGFRTLSCPLAPMQTLLRRTAQQSPHNIVQLWSTENSKGVDAATNKYGEVDLLKTATDKDSKVR